MQKNNRETAIFSFLNSGYLEIEKLITNRLINLKNQLAKFLHLFTESWLKLEENN